MLVRNTVALPLVDLYRVALPVKYVTSRDAYMQKCLTNGTVAIKNESGIQHNARFPSGDFHKLVFPYSFLDDGNMVAVNRALGSDELYVVAIYPMEGIAITEPTKGVGIASGSDTSYGSVCAYEEGTIKTEVYSEYGGEITAEALGENSQVNTNVDGSYDVRSKRATIKGGDSVRLRQNSGYVNMNSDNVELRHIKKVKINVSTNEEPSGDLTISEENMSASHVKDVQFSVDVDGESKALINITEQGVTIDALGGKVSIKNDSTDLLTVHKETLGLIDKILKALNTFTGTTLVPDAPTLGSVGLTTAITAALASLKAQLVPIMVPLVETETSKLLK